MSGGHASSEGVASSVEDLRDWFVEDALQQVGVSRRRANAVDDEMNVARRIPSDASRDNEAVSGNRQTTLDAGG